MGKFRNAITKARNLYEQWKMRRKLRCTDFSIISNNCWAGTAVYQPFGLKYNTPTVGLGFVDDDYIKFLEKFDYYLSLTPQFIDPQKAKNYELRKRLRGHEIDYPVAMLDDITIWFTHYQSASEALEKWERRKSRINRERILVKWSQRYGNDPGLLRRFLALPFKNKIAFVASAAECNNSQVIVVPELENLNIVGGDETESTLKKINITKILNSIE